MSVTYTLTVGGTEKNIQIGTLEIAEVSNGTGVMRLDILSDADVSPVYRPTLGAEVILERTDTSVSPDTERIFAGYVEKVREGGPNGQPVPDLFILRLECVDYNVLTERKFITETYAAGTLKSMLQTIVTNDLSEYGITLSASQVDGPTLTEIDAAGVMAAEVLGRFSQQSGYTWRIDYNKALRMTLAGEESAPFNVVDTDDPPDYIGDVEVERSRAQYFNRVHVRAGTAVIVDKTDTFAADGMEDTFTLSHQLISTPTVGYGYVQNGVDANGDPDYETLDLAGQGAEWTYDPNANTITRTTGAPDNGETVTITYRVQFPITVTVEDASEIALNGVYETIVDAPTVFDAAEAEALAEEYLSSFLDIIETVRYRSHTHGAHPGQQQTITVAARDLDGLFLITEVRTRNPRTMQDMEYQVSAVSVERFRGSFRNTYNDWNQRGSRTTVNGATASPGTQPAPPNRSVQFNRSSAFGGDAAFTYDEDTNCLICGDSCTITAFDPDSCQVFGQNCHIADP